MLDSIFKTLMRAVSPESIELRCGMAIFNRSVCHNISYLFIIMRIWVVFRISKLQDEIIKAQEKQT